MDDLTLDGNAIGGLLIEVFGTEMTTAVGTCGNCGAVGQVAEFAVYRPGPGSVVRCRACDSVLMVFTEIRGVTCVDLMGLASLTPGPDAAFALLGRLRCGCRDHAPGKRQQITCEFEHQPC